MRNKDICRKTSKPCDHCTDGPCQYRGKMCNGCIHHRRLSGGCACIACMCVLDTGHVTYLDANGLCAYYKRGQKKRRKGEAPWSSL